MMTEQLLRDFGLTDNEIKIYLTVLKQGKISITKLASLTRIKRTTMYSIVKKLATLGIVTEDIGGKITYLVALPPDQWPELLDEEQKSLDQKKKLATKIAKELKPMASKAGYSVPKIRFIEEQDLEKHLNAQIPVWIESMLQTDPTWWGYQDNVFPERFIKWIDTFWKRAPQEVDLKLLTNDSKFERTIKNRYPRRKLKFWDKTKDFNGTTWVVGDYVMMLVVNQKPEYMVEIHDPVMARNMRNLFKAIWAEVK